MLQGTAADTLLRNWYDSTTVANIGLFKTVSDPADVNPEYALTLNESINPDNHAEENEKAVNAIYLVTWAVDSFELTPEQYDILYAIANENPLTGGTGVYAARVMLGLHIDDDYESIGSRMASNVQNQNATSSLTDNRVSLMPNPAKDESVYRIFLNRNETGSMIVYSKLGIKLLNKQLVEGNNTFSIPLTELGAGVYFVQTYVNGKNTDIRKLVVVQ